MNTITDITQQAVERLMLDLVMVAMKPED